MLGNVTLTFKSLSKEKPPYNEYVLVVARDEHRRQFFMIACLTVWDEDTPDENTPWCELGSDDLIDDLDKWSTWAYLPTEADGD